MNTHEYNAKWGMYLEPRTRNVDERAFAEANRSLMCQIFLSLFLSLFFFFGASNTISYHDISHESRAEQSRAEHSAPTSPHPTLSCPIMNIMIMIF